MKALVKTASGFGGLALLDLPEPVALPGQVLMAVRAAALCGTDVHIAHGTLAIRPPLILGHELAGVVAAVGAGVTGIDVGARITTETDASVCGECAHCRAGDQHRCRIGRRSGRHLQVGSPSSWPSRPPASTSCRPWSTSRPVHSPSRSPSRCARGHRARSSTRRRRRGHRPGHHRAPRGAGGHGPRRHRDSRRPGATPGPLPARPGARESPARPRSTHPVSWSRWPRAVTAWVSTSSSSARARPNRSMPACASFARAGASSPSHSRGVVACLSTSTTSWATSSPS